ncbi:MAG TPA: DJ-1/PfpI family protein [Sedimentisphaerales bacterium]|nr:DJ-1/PfpI family protein [Sedimentisphaerales bacterium]
MLGGVAEAVAPLNDLCVDDFNAIVFVGGSGAVKYINSPVALGMVREAADKGKILAAIGVAPLVLQCGLCSFVCPSKMDLTEKFIGARQLIEKEKEEIRQEEEKQQRLAEESVE